MQQVLRGFPCVASISTLQLMTNVGCKRTEQVLHPKSADTHNMPQDHLKFASHTPTLSSSSMQSYCKFLRGRIGSVGTLPYITWHKLRMALIKTTPVIWSLSHQKFGSSYLPNADCWLTFQGTLSNCLITSHWNYRHFKSIPQQAHGQPRNLHCTTIDHQQSPFHRYPHL